MSAPKDPVAAAVAAVEEQAVALRQIPVTIASTGRPAIVAIPADATDSELAELAGWLLTSVMQAHRAERAKADALAPKIHTPSGLHVVRPT